MAGARWRLDWGPWTVRWPWLWPLGTVVLLVGIAAVLVAVAHSVYDPRDPDGWGSVLATGVLIGAVAAVLGAAIAALVAVTSEIRARGESEAAKRLELFQRMRTAHVQVALAQQLLRAHRDDETYHEQMRGLLKVVKDLEEIREEVRVSGRLYGPDHRPEIMHGIALIIVFLQHGVAEYMAWCREPAHRGPHDLPRSGWLVDLIEIRSSAESRLDPAREDWEPEGNMPEGYDKGLFKSKLVMRAYVYGANAQRMTRRHR